MNPNLRKRIEALEASAPKEGSEFDAFLSRCSDDELRRVIAITKKDESPSEDIDFMVNLVKKYAHSGQSDKAGDQGD